MNGFTFRGHHSDEFDAFWKTESRPFLPIVKTVTENLTECDGDYDFSNVNIDSRQHYENRAFSGMLTVKADNLKELHLKFSKIANWLEGGYGDLIFDDMPETVWSAKIENVEQVTYELRRLGKIRLVFTVKPFSRFLYRSTEPVILDSNIILDTALALDGETYRFEVSGDSGICVRNYGDWYTAPIVTVSGEFSYLEIKAFDEKKIRYFGGCGSDDTIGFDFSKNQIMKNGVLDNLNSLGHYWDFVPGANQLEILTDGIADLTFFMEFYFKYGAVIV